MSLLSLTPTFTQGLVLGQLSILILLGLILRYLFFETTLPIGSDDEDDEDAKDSNATSPPHISMPIPNPSQNDSFMAEHVQGSQIESVEWLNLLLDGMAKAYRADLRGQLPGTAGNEAARRRVERWAQTQLASSILAPIKISSVNLGTSAPQLSNARMRKVGDYLSCTDLDVTYIDTISVSLSTSFLFNYPTSFFARLPISLTLSLSLFSGTVTLTPPTATTPSFTLSLLPSFTLKLTQSSLLGSRTKLSDVPKVHDMIAQRIRGAIANKLGTYRILLPGIGEHAVVPRLGLQKREVDVLVEE